MNRHCHHCERKQHKSHKNYKVPEEPLSEGETGCAMILKVTSNCVTDSTIYFNQGLGNESQISVSSQGDVITFQRRGLYRFVIQGKVNLGTTSLGELKFKRTPGFKVEQEAFTRFEVKSGKLNLSTILPLHQGDTLSICLESKGTLALGSGTQLEIYKVGNF